MICPLTHYYTDDEQQDEAYSSKIGALTDKTNVWHVLVKRGTGEAVGEKGLMELKASVFDPEGMGGCIVNARVATSGAATSSARSPTPVSPPSVLPSPGKSGGPCDNCGATGMQEAYNNVVGT